MRCLLIFLLAAVPGFSNPDADAKGVAFFESRVRPILIQRCFECHSESAGKQKGGLLLDRRSGWMEGGNSGPAVVPGDVAKSLLVQAVRHLDPEFAMPEEQLPEEEIAALMHWVKIGAPGGKTDLGETEFSRLGNQEYLSEQAESHWSFQPVKAGPIPKVDGVVHPVDRFLAGPMREKGVEPSPLADRRSLLRRLSFDLTGLPPGYEQVEDFVRDDRSPKVEIERLLASPAFGERWARHWLDFARYADTREFLPAGADTRYPYAYTYRDYVIEAYNSDMPVNQFIREQLAADLIPDLDPQHLAALGFLTVGSRFRNNRHEIYNDRIDVVTRGFMGLSVACARCHDHMYDPIPTTDYYALFGVFDSVSDLLEYPVIPHRRGMEPPSYVQDDFEKKRGQVVKDYEDYKNGLAAEARRDFRIKADDYLGRAHDMMFRRQDVRKALSGTTLKETALTPLVNNLRGMVRTKANAKDLVVGPLLAVIRAPEKDYIKTRDRALAGPMDPVIRAGLKARPLPNRKAFMVRFGEVLVQAAKDDVLPVTRWLARDTGPFRFTPQNCLAASNLFGKGRLKRASLERAINDIDSTHPGAPPRAMAVQDKQVLMEGQVFLRGNAASRGERVPRRYLSIFGGEEFTQGSGRLELADRIADPANPLTARVYANRVWMHLMGTSLVATPGDWGLQAPEPVHAELLDFLAYRLVLHNWSTKTLIEIITTSQAYRRSSAADPAMVALDPDNIYYARANMKRLGFEAMRDATLSVAGNLEDGMYGRAVDITEAPFSTRRTVYGFIDRVNLDDMFAVFDFPSPDAIATERTETLVPQQALFSMNDPFLHAQARELVSRYVGAGGIGPGGVGASGAGFESRLTALYRAVFQRDPRPAEIRVGQAFLQAAVKTKDEKRTRDWKYGYGSADPLLPPEQRFTEFRYWDPKQNAWQVSKIFPHPVTSYARRYATGGNPGRSNRQGAVLRWTAPYSGTFALEGELRHFEKEKGDGVIGEIIHSRHGLLRKVPVRGRAKRLEVAEVACRKGDVVDFIVMMGESQAFDRFAWSPEIRSLQMAEMVPVGQKTNWIAQADFEGPQPPMLTPWQQLAHALLMSNEFLYLD